MGRGDTADVRSLRGGAVGRSAAGQALVFPSVEVAFFVGNTDAVPCSLRVTSILRGHVSVEEEPRRALDRRMARTVRPLRRWYGSLLCNARGELGRALREGASHHRAEEWREQPHRSLRP